MSVQPGQVEREKRRLERRRRKARAKAKQEAFLRSMSADDWLDLAALYSYYDHTHYREGDTGDVPRSPRARRKWLNDWRPSLSEEEQKEAKEVFDALWSGGDPPPGTPRSVEDLYKLLSIQKVFPDFSKMTPEEAQAVRRGEDPFTQFDEERDSPREREGVGPVRGRIYEDVGSRGDRLSGRGTRRMFRYHPVFSPGTQPEGMWLWGNLLKAGGKKVFTEVLGPALAKRQDQQREMVQDRLATLRGQYEPSYSRGWWNTMEALREVPPEDLLKTVLRGDLPGQEPNRLGVQGRAYAHWALINKMKPGFFEVPQEGPLGMWAPIGESTGIGPEGRNVPWFPDKLENVAHFVVTGGLSAFLPEAEPPAWENPGSQIHQAREGDLMKEDNWDVWNIQEKNAALLGQYEAMEFIHRQIIENKESLDQVNQKFEAGTISEREATRRTLGLMGVEITPSLNESLNKLPDEVLPPEEPPDPVPLSLAQRDALIREGKEIPPHYLVKTEWDEEEKKKFEEEWETPTPTGSLQEIYGLDDSGSPTGMTPEQAYEEHFWQKQDLPSDLTQTEPFPGWSPPTPEQTYQQEVLDWHPPKIFPTDPSPDPAPKTKRVKRRTSFAKDPLTGEYLNPEVWIEVPE